MAAGSFNRSGLNYEAGAKIPLAALLAGVLLMGIVLLVAPLAAYLPNVAMAVVLLLVAWGLIGSGMNFIDVAGAGLLVQEAQRLRRDGRSLCLFRANSQVPQLA